ncbi:MULTISPECIES: class I SAM-dependent methyltransferase [unclassified Streptomyces]|uniref:SAM-dependent methyltransferase n=1 Tax=unclassified Streptomyces TaxID=2593676 RepID=UPI002E81B5CC|nr:class I SAM-dependent methyltransferase [Streptomyces sp. NBC_00569]WSE13333.1 class I SAM-dependent methyltransferase [Streptomyces sp. NBC_01397]WUB97750.1 class I SAM-dependent methyltransferase [Streptomyces sp. NBC_00569]
MTAPQPSAVARHYRQGDLRRKIDEALDRLYPGHTALTTDDLHGVDEFHTGGHAATRELAEHLELRAGLRVLDVGSGLGGPARHLAQHAGADVTGVDLTEEYVDVARWLTDRVGLTGRARFQQGDVTALPFPRASFDRAWMLHVGMNIEDKARLFTEISRVLTDEGLFIVYDVMLLGNPALVRYPLPWASEPEHSFLAHPQEYRSRLRKAGFDIVAEHDHRLQAVQSLRDAGGAHHRTRTPHNPAGGDTPPAPISVAMGSDASTKVAKVLQNIEEGLLAPTEMICRRR